MTAQRPQAPPNLRADGVNALEFFVNLKTRLDAVLNDEAPQTEYQQDDGTFKVVVPRRLEAEVPEQQFWYGGVLVRLVHK